MSKTKEALRNLVMTILASAALNSVVSLTFDANLLCLGILFSIEALLVIVQTIVLAIVANGE